jgi:hypothetical protein
MKYYILGKSENFTATRNSDSNLLEKYWELGWEIGTSRIIIIKKLLSNEISNEDTTIVTLRDRMFFYESIFKNVIAYEDFINMNHSDMEIITYPSDYNFIINNDNSVDMLDKNLIEKILDTEKEIIPNAENNFFIIHYRERPWGGNRNVSIDDYFAIIEKIINMGYDFFIYGKNANSIGEKYGKNELTLSQANTYLSSDKCIGFIGPLSGGSMIALLSHKGKHHILDFSRSNLNDNILYHGDASNFIGAEIINYNNINQVLENLN